jgi:hypothetical protein
VNSDEANELNKKLDRIENLIQDLATRTGNLEQLIGTGPYNIRRSGAPPVMGVPQQPQQPQPAPIAPAPPNAPAAPIPTQPAYRQVNAPDFPQKEVTFPIAGKPKGDGTSVDEAEYKIGLNGLLKGGAIIVILGLLYLVALAIQRGIITLRIQFIGEILLCLGFIGIGHWKRKEREEFGQILTGIGSCGLYFSIAGAHAYKNLYEAEVVVGLFLVLSLANLAYSFWHSSRAFLLIGMVGGLIGSILPMKEDRTILTTVLHFLVILPSAAIIIRNRWSAFAVVMSLVSSAALIPVFFSHEPWLTRIIVMYGAAAISCFVYAKTFEKQSWDPQAVFIPFSASSAAIGGLLLDHIAVRNVTGSTNPAHGSYQVLYLSAILGTLAYYFRADKLIWQVLAVTAVSISAILAPIGLERTPEAFTFLALSLPLAFAAIRWKSIALSTLAWVVFGLGLTAYVAFWSTDTFNPRFETPFLLFAMAGAGVQSWATHKLGQKSESASLVTSLLCLPMLLRMSELWITPVWDHNTGRGMMAGFAFFAVISLAISLRHKWAGFALFAAIGILFSGMAFMAGLPYLPEEETALLLFFVALLAGFSAVTGTLKSESMPFQVGGPAILITLIITRLSIVILEGPRVPAGSAAAIGLLSSAFLWALLSKRFSWLGALVAGWIAAFVGALSSLFTDEIINYMNGAFGIHPSRHMALDLSLLVASILGFLAIGAVTKPNDSKSRNVEQVLAVLLLPLWTRISHLLLSEIVGISMQASISAAWIAYGCICIAIGFRYKIRILRYFSFAVFGVTVAKVLLLDLSGLDPGIRVVILLALGMAMIVGGYLYIRAKSEQISTEENVIEK